MATQDEVRLILERTEIIDLIGEDIELRKAGKDFQALCPFHDEKTPSFTVAQDKQFYHCFGCGAHGDAIAWLVEYKRLPFLDALHELAGRAGITLGNAIPGEKLARKNNRINADIEAALHHEFMILDATLGRRVVYRQIPAADKKKYAHIQPPPEQQYEREYEAAKRIVKGLVALYGVST
jgi:DNA primase catalytic core